MLAYNILIGEHSSEEKGYCKRLFDKLQAFSAKDGVRHIKAVVLGDDDCSSYIKMLINMAEPELTGMLVHVAVMVHFFDVVFLLKIFLLL
jgi:hypothetical protein